MRFYRTELQCRTQASTVSVRSNQLDLISWCTGSTTGFVVPARDIPRGVGEKGKSRGRVSSEYEMRLDAMTATEASRK